MADPRTTFLSLPLELRNKIYEESLFATPKPAAFDRKAHIKHDSKMVDVIEDGLDLERIPFIWKKFLERVRVPRPRSEKLRLYCRQVNDEVCELLEHMARSRRSVSYHLDVKFYNDGRFNVIFPQVKWISIQQVIFFEPS